MNQEINDQIVRGGQPKSITRNSKLFKSILEGIYARKGEDIVSLDLRKIDESVADFFVICQAKTSVQVASLATSIIEEVYDATGEKPYRYEKGPHWTLVDFVNVVVHIFHEEHRKFYDLENLWADAPHMEHSEELEIKNKK